MKFRGVFFNPNVKHKNMAGYPWPVFDPYDTQYRTQIRAALRELATEAKINLIDVFIPIPFTLRQRSGIRSLDGRWKTDLLQAVKQQAQGK